VTKENGKAIIYRQSCERFQENRSSKNCLLPISGGEKAGGDGQTDASVLRLAGPDLISNTSDKLQLLAHILIFERVTLGMRSKTTLR
jgi:hypothetical protein